VLAAERRQLLQALERAAATATRRLSALQQQLDRAQHEAEPLRHAGELILAYQSALPLGSTELRVDDQRFELDPRLSAVDNAQAAFARYRRLRDASERVPELLDAAQQQLEHLQQLRALVEVADSMDAVRALRQEVAEASGGHEGSRKARSAPRAPYRRVGLGDGWEALVGTSAAGNAAVTFEQARPHDWWLHAHGVPGAHVILRGEGEPPPPVLERAAELAAWYSAARSAARVEVDVAPRRYVRKIPHGPPGLVRYTNERTVRVKPSA
jgi:predicted ribosome quality control (RQC) complex YloA/Tae2 family protein